jgi:hypothetical protein
MCVGSKDSVSLIQNLWRRGSWIKRFADTSNPNLSQYLFAQIFQRRGKVVRPILI